MSSSDEDAKAKRLMKAWRHRVAGSAGLAVERAESVHTYYFRIHTEAFSPETILRFVELTRAAVREELPCLKGGRQWRAEVRGSYLSAFLELKDYLDISSRPFPRPKRKTLQGLSP